MSAEHLLPLLPEAAIAVGVVAVMIGDMALPSGRKAVAGIIAVFACAAALLLAATGARGGVAGVIAVDGLAAVARPAILIAAILVLMAGRCEQERDDGHPAWAALILSLTLGAMLTAGATSMVTLYLGLELMSLAGYALAAWRGGGRAAAEAGMKYVLFGGAASGVMLFGMSHLYGLTGHLGYAGIGDALGDGAPFAVLGALALAGVGVAFKMAVVPLHIYAPDVYQGAPASAVAVLGTLPKIAAAAAIVRLVSLAVPESLLPPATLGLGLALIAVASLLVAAFTAIASRDAKRIVAFSAIGHAGAVMLALAALPEPGAVAAAAFYLAAYAPATIGALTCLAVLERERGSASLDALAGAMRQRPWLSTALCLFLFSLAGIPPLAGFLAKWGVLREALRLGLAEPSRAYLAWSALALLISTAVAAWAYLLVVRAVVLQPAPEQPRAPRLAPGTAAVLLLCAAATVGLGLWLDGFAAITRAMGFR
jgi:NADH-quinone oxidoreductase subunit N